MREEGGGKKEEGSEGEGRTEKGMKCRHLRNKEVGVQGGRANVLLSKLMLTC